MNIFIYINTNRNIQISWIIHNFCRTILSDEFDRRMELESRVRLREMMKKQWQFLAMYNDETIPGAQLRNLIGTNVFRSLMRFLHAHRATNVPVMFDNYSGNN